MVWSCVRRRSLGPLRDVETLGYRRSCHEGFQGPRDMREIRHAHEISCFVEADEVANPREGSDVGNRITVAHDPGTVSEPSVQYAEQALRFRDVAVARAFVFVILAREFIEESHLAEHGADGAHLKH